MAKENAKAEIGEEQDPVENVEESKKETNIASFLPKPRDERSEEVEILRAENEFT